MHLQIIICYVIVTCNEFQMGLMVPRNTIVQFTCDIYVCKYAFVVKFYLNILSVKLLCQMQVVWH